MNGAQEIELSVSRFRVLMNRLCTPYFIMFMRCYVGKLYSAVRYIHKMLSYTYLYQFQS